MKRDLAKEKRGKKVVTNWLDRRIGLANRHGKAIQTTAEGDRLWAERNLRDVYNLEFMRMGAAKERAERMAEAGPKVFGVVAVVNRIDDHAKWEEMARAIDAGKQVIDVEALSGVPQENVHGSRGEIGGVPEQLGSGVPAKGETRDGKEEEGQGNEEARVLATGGGR